MWLIVAGDGDIDYTRVFGPFDSEAQATAQLPEDSDDHRWRVVELEDCMVMVAVIEEDQGAEFEAAEGDDEDDSLDTDADGIVTEVFDADDPLARQKWLGIDSLLEQYGSLDNIPTHSAPVRQYAEWEIGRINIKLQNEAFRDSHDGRAIFDLLSQLQEDDFTQTDPDEVNAMRADIQHYEALLANTLFKAF